MIPRSFLQLVSFFPEMFGQRGYDVLQLTDKLSQVPRLVTNIWEVSTSCDWLVLQTVARTWLTLIMTWLWWVKRNCYTLRA